jgi:hypothetical protein
MKHLGVSEGDVLGVMMGKRKGRIPPFFLELSFIFPIFAASKTIKKIEDDETDNISQIHSPNDGYVVGWREWPGGNDGR